MLVSLGREEVEAAVVSGGGAARVRCEFCGQSYAFTPGEIEQLFATAGRELDAPPRLQ
jgi:molecular chaperone Hsp33